MEPRIQYAKTKDGVSIAFATYGQGDPIVWATHPETSHVQLEWQQPIIQAPISRLVSGRRMVVRFDMRGKVWRRHRLSNPQTSMMRFTCVVVPGS